MDLSADCVLWIPPCVWSHLRSDRMFQFSWSIYPLDPLEHSQYSSHCRVPSAPYRSPACQCRSQSPWCLQAAGVWTMPLPANTAHLRSSRQHSRFSDSCQTSESVLGIPPPLRSSTAPDYDKIQRHWWSKSWRTVRIFPYPFWSGPHMHHRK